jgi:hypothetical protein
MAEFLVDVGRAIGTLLGIIRETVRRGTHWARLLIRVAVGIVLLWPVLVIGAALSIPDRFYSTATAIVALLPLVAVLSFLFACTDPLIWAAIAALPQGRRTIVPLAAIVGTELALGVYFSVVPVWRDRALVPLLVLTALALVFLRLGGIKNRLVAGILFLLILVITAIFLLGGRNKLALPHLDEWLPAQKGAGGSLRKELANTIQALVGRAPYAGHNPSAVSISRHRYEHRENDHEHDHLQFFDVVLTGDKGDSGVGEFCKEGDIVPPADWIEWRKYWVSFEPNRHFGILYTGFSESYGPFGANLPPPDDERFRYKPRSWCLQGVGTLRYERVR